MSQVNNFKDTKEKGNNSYILAWGEFLFLKKKSKDMKFVQRYDTMNTEGERKMTFL